MSRAVEIYPYLKAIQRELDSIKSDPHNSEILLKYYHSRFAEGISTARIYKCINTLKLISKLLSMPFEKATKDDIVRLVADIESKDFADCTKRDYKIIIKHFYKWLRNSDDVVPSEVRWIKNLHATKNRHPILPKDLFTSEEKLALARAAQNPRDRALVEVFGESGRRLGEILTLHIGDVEFDSMGAKLFVNGKVGEDFARIISSAPSLAIWLDVHPLRDNPEAPVWVGLGHLNRFKQLSYGAASTLLKKMAKRAGIKKRIHYYLFRHTRIDETQGILTEAQQCMMFGWKFGSRMPAVYMKRYGKHIDNAQAIMNGVEIPKKESFEPLVAKTCFRCNNSNSPASKFCNVCGNALDTQTAIQMDESKQLVESLLTKITENPDKMQKLRRLLRS